MSLLEVFDAVVVFSPDRDAEARALGLPRVAFVAVSPTHVRSAEERAVRADAYASDKVSLQAAVFYARKERREERKVGPLRVVYLGALNEEPVMRATPIGHSVPIGDAPLIVGRSDDCAICLRQGAHSDQNTTARRHATIERAGDRVLVTDLGSTNGTWVRDLSIQKCDVAPGEEITIAFGHRLRIDGRP